MKRAIIVLVLVLLVVSFTKLPRLARVVKATNSDLECYTLYFFNGIVVYNSTITETLMLETPGNSTLLDGFTQIVEHVVYYNVEYNESIGAFQFTVRESEFFEGFFLSRVRVCTKPMSTVLTYLRKALQDPQYGLGAGDVPGEIREQYVRTPSEIVVDVVVPAYESWFRSRYNIDISEASPLGISVTAAYFIYIEYIKYNASALPKTLEEVVNTRTGDCDDMSRVLVELLNYYGIPALMVYGYTVIGGFNMTIPVENTTYMFVNNGPHAFTITYIPGFGWMSVDLLAGSLIIYPFIVENYTRETVVKKEAVERVIDLHRALNATQVLAVLTEREVVEVIGENITQSSVYEFFKKILEGGVEQVEQTPTPTSTPTETPTPTPTRTPTPTPTPALTPSPTPLEPSVFARRFGLVLAVSIAVLVLILALSRRSPR